MKEDYIYVNTRDKGIKGLKRFGDKISGINGTSVYDDIFLTLKSDILLRDIEDFTRKNMKVKYNGM